MVINFELQFVLVIQFLMLKVEIPMVIAGEFIQQLMFIELILMVQAILAIEIVLIALRAMFKLASTPQCFKHFLQLLMIIIGFINLCLLADLILIK